MLRVGGCLRTHWQSTLAREEIMGDRIRNLAIETERRVSAQYAGQVSIEWCVSRPELCDDHTLVPAPILADSANCPRRCSEVNGAQFLPTLQSDPLRLPAQGGLEFPVCNIGMLQASNLSRVGELCRDFGFRVHSGLFAVRGHVFVARYPVNSDCQSGSLLRLPKSLDFCPERSE